MSLSEAYGAKPDYTVMTLDQWKNDLLLMGVNDKLVYDSRIKVDDDLQLMDLIATIKNLKQEKNDSSDNITISSGIQP